MNRHHFPITAMLCYAGILLSSVMVYSCKSTHTAANDHARQKSIVILYENDVHCGIDGYSKLRGLADAILQSDTSYVGIVSSGDFLQGALAGAYSRGQYIVDIMRHVGYDAITLGNHEFDYGAPRMFELLPQIGAPIVSSNFCDYATQKPFYQPYVIKQYGEKRIAFVGVTTTETLRAESYAFFDNNRKQLYDLCPSQLVQLVQKAIDQAHAEGADYVVLLSHMGEQASEDDLTSQDLVAATRGIDAVLDGHSHSIIPVNPVANIDGKLIPVSQTGTQFENIGKLWIAPDGRFVTSLVANNTNPYTNAHVTAVTDSIKALLEQATSRQVANVAFDMPVQDANGLWIVRRNESPMGNLVSDAFRWKMNAAIGLVNGGGLRNSIKAGSVNYGHVISVQPFDNLVCLIEATGQQIIDMLAKCVAKCPEADGSFPQVSGMRYTIHTATHTVSDITVFDKQTNAYLPLDLQRTYTIATTDYYNNGGYYDTLQDCRLIENTQILARDVITEYLEKQLKGNIDDSYHTTQGRITIVDD